MGGVLFLVQKKIIMLRYQYYFNFDCMFLLSALFDCLQINLPPSVCKRWLHSVCSIAMNATTHWIIVTGGVGIEGANVAMIVELG